MAMETAIPNGSDSVQRLGFFRRNRAVILFIAGIVAALVVARLPITGVTRELQLTLAAFTFVVVMWVAEVLPVGVSAVLFCMVLVVLLGKKMPATVVFSGFSNPTIWLMIGALLLGEATVTTGVANRIAYLTMRLGGSSHRRLLIYVWLAQTILALITPAANARAAMFIPIMVGIVQAYKAKPNSRFASNLLLHIFWAIQFGAALWYTGTIINPQIMGILRAVTGYGPSYFVYVVWNFIPMMIFAVATFIIIEWMMPAEKDLIKGGNVDILDKKLAEMGPMSADEWKALIFFVVAIALWATEKLHHIETSWVALGLAGLLFLPRVGVLKAKALSNLNWDIILLMAVSLGIINIMSVVKLDIWVTDQVLAPILNPLASLGSAGLALGVTLAVALVHFIASSALGEGALMGPLVIKFAYLMGYNAPLAALVTSRAEMHIFLFPYQMTPLLLLWGPGYLDMKRCLRCFGITSLFNIAWIVAMAPIWEWTMKLVK
ncbi:MAG TPA: SLC13 family permease [Syntrophorhabdales bacterium]|nr:SLC13 family permease [Syntrophorhabdales bacterium]